MVRRKTDNLKEAEHADDAQNRDPNRNWQSGN
jgi:hypothetical protein